jgi:hypothetical protein
MTATHEIQSLRWRWCRSSPKKVRVAYATSTRATIGGRSQGVVGDGCNRGREVRGDPYSGSEHLAVTVPLPRPH